MLSAYWLLPSYEAHLQGAFSMVQSRAPAERQRSQAPPLGLQTREVHCSWKMLVLPGDNYLLLNSAAPVLLKVNPARRKEKKTWLCNYLQLWVTEVLFACCKEGCRSIYPDRIRLPAVTWILECDQFMLKLYDVGAAVAGEGIRCLKVFFPKLYS